MNRLCRTNYSGSVQSDSSDHVRQRFLFHMCDSAKYRMTTAICVRSDFYSSSVFFFAVCNIGYLD